MIGFELINTMNTRIAYEFSSFDDFILVPVTFDAGIKENIIPEKAEIQYKAIVEDINYVVRIKNLLLTTAKSICELFSAEAEIIFENK
jgi:metal-dependent amidase/aminoacylase/carboxypeptidase family protein